MKKYTLSAFFALCVMVVFGLTVTQSAYAQDINQPTQQLAASVSQKPDSSDEINSLKQQFFVDGNSADFINGDSAILSGDITGILNVLNGPLNIHNSRKDCCGQNTSHDTIPTTPSGGNVPSPTQLIPFSNPLPISDAYRYLSTGTISESYSWIILALFGNIMMLLHSSYLRLRSGRSPSPAFFV